MTTGEQEGYDPEAAGQVAGKFYNQDMQNNHTYKFEIVAQGENVPDSKPSHPLIVKVQYDQKPLNITARINGHTGTYNEPDVMEGNGGEAFIRIQNKDSQDYKDGLALVHNPDIKNARCLEVVIDGRHIFIDTNYENPFNPEETKPELLLPNGLGQGSHTIWARFLPFNPTSGAVLGSQPAGPWTKYSLNITQPAVSNNYNWPKFTVEDIHDTATYSQKNVATGNGFNILIKDPSLGSGIDHWEIQVNPAGETFENSNAAQWSTFNVVPTASGTTKVFIPVNPGDLTNTTEKTTASDGVHEYSYLEGNYQIRVKAVRNALNMKEEKIAVQYLDKNEDEHTHNYNAHSDWVYMVKKIAISGNTVLNSNETQALQEDLIQPVKSTFIIESRSTDDNGESVLTQREYSGLSGRAYLNSKVNYDVVTEDNWALLNASYYSERKTAEYSGNVLMGAVKEDITTELGDIQIQDAAKAKVQEKLNTILADYPGDISLRKYNESQDKAPAVAFYLPNYSKQAVISVGQKSVNIFDPALNRAYTFDKATGGLVVEDEKLGAYNPVNGTFEYLIGTQKEVIKADNSTAAVQELLSRLGVDWTDRKADVTYLADFIKNNKINNPELWIRNSYGKSIYMIYDGKSRYPVITIDDLRVHFGEKQNGKMWRQREIFKIEPIVPVTTPMVAVTKELEGEVTSSAELKGFPFTDANTLPETLEKYTVYTSSETWYTYYQEPRDIFGRLIMIRTSLAEGTYYYYVKEYDNTTNIYQPKLAYVYFQPKDSDKWITCYRYDTQSSPVDFKAFNGNRSFNSSEMAKVNDTLSFIKFSKNYSALNADELSQINEVQLIKTTVTDAENRSYDIFVVKGDNEGRVVFKIKDDALIVNSEFFGYTTTAKSGYFRNLKTQEVWNFENLDMQNAIVNISGKSYYLPDDKESTHRVRFWNEKTGEDLFRWYPVVDPIGGRYASEERGFFVITKEPSVNETGETIPGNVKWMQTTRDDLIWSESLEVPLFAVHSEYSTEQEKFAQKSYQYDPRIEGYVKEYFAQNSDKNIDLAKLSAFLKANTTDIETRVEEQKDLAIVNSSNASQFIQTDWTGALKNLDRSKYLTNGEKAELNQTTETGVDLRKVNLVYLYGATEDKYYPLTPFQDAKIVVGETETAVNLNWSPDNKGSIYRTTVEVDRSGLGVKKVRTATSEFEKTDTIISQNAGQYQNTFSRDLSADLNFYSMAFGKGETVLRKTEETEFALGASTSGNNSYSYSSTPKLTSEHYVFSKDPSANDIFVRTHLLSNATTTALNAWSTPSDAPLGILPGSVVVSKKGESGWMKYSSITDQDGQKIITYNADFKEDDNNIADVAFRMTGTRYYEIYKETFGKYNRVKLYYDSNELPLYSTQLTSFSGIKNL
ncbi:MAG: hypothetical protein NT030_07445, partial [Candidatus Saganbacteria bacterium]|nr:hypothetical protein [Candidatus Saganbacteria bacterium]